jgi:uncharacterized membrane protein YhhN
MNSIRFFLFLLFWLALLIDCFLIALNHPEYRIYTKTLLAPLLLLTIYIEARDTKHERSKILVNLAFFFCFIGDFLLIKDAETVDSSGGYFVFGIISFLIAQLFFIFFFYRLKRFSAKHRIFIFITGFLVTIYIALLLFLIWRNVSLQSLQIPIVVYAVILGLMIMTAINTIKNKSLKRLASNYFIPGAALFVLSDSILAINKFSHPFYYGAIAAMITYGGAIFLLANGIVRFLKK